MPELAPWDTTPYRRIVDVAFDGRLRVRFEDGSDVVVDPDRLVRPDARGLRWDQAALSEGDVVVPADDHPVDISWFDIRALSDPAFRAHLMQDADDEARRIGQRLRALREARGMTAKEVARAAGIAPLSLSRIELGRHDVVYRTLRRILAAMNYSLRDLAEAAEPELSTTQVVERLNQAGVHRRVLEKLLRSTGEQSERVVAAVGRIFGWSPFELAGEQPLALRPVVAGVGRFKSQVNQNPELATYTFWAHWLALLVDRACPRPAADVPQNPEVIRRELVERAGTVNFEALLHWCWEHGIAVLPLDDPGEFHGAAWLIEGTAVIVLKQRTPWTSRWTFDLGHEVGHMARHLDEATAAIVEVGEVNPAQATDDEDEQEANDYAGDLLLGDADELARELAERTRGDIRHLKREVVTLAKERGVEADALANYMAYRLDLEGEDWWATAATLQDDSGRAPELARKVLMEHLQWDLLSPDDAALLQAALERGGSE